MKSQTKWLALATAATAFIVFVPGQGASGATTGADLQMSGSAGKASAGEGFSYTFQVKNSGPDAAPGAVFTDVLPAGTVYNYATENAQALPCGATAVDSIGTVVTCNLGFLTKGSQATVIVNVKAPTTSGSFSNTGTVLSTAFDPFIGNNSVTVTSQVNVVTCAVPAGDTTVSGLVMQKYTNVFGLFENFQLQVSGVNYTVITNFYDGTAPLTRLINLDCKQSPVQFVSVANVVNVTGTITTAVLPGATAASPVIYASVVQVLTHNDRI